MQSRHLILLFISILGFSSFSFSQENEKSYEACDDMTSLSFVGGCLIGEESQNNMHLVLGLSLEAPIGKKFFVAPECFLIKPQGQNYDVSLFSFLFRYRIINSKKIILPIQSGLGIVGSRLGGGILFQIGLKPEINLNDNIKIGIDCRMQTSLLGSSFLKFYAISININL
jgi:hypothetical protein